MRWRGTEVVRVIRMRAAGQTAERIARDLGRSPGSVRELVRRQGLILDRTLAAIMRERAKRRLRKLGI